ncbi:MAG: hypothetical protein AABZ60_06990 [Planctomycetota bacterium]
MKYYVAGFFGLILLALFSIWKDYQVIMLGKETERLRKQTEEIKHENNLFRFECQRLEEPGRLFHLNKTLKLQLAPIPPQQHSPTEK